MKIGIDNGDDFAEYYEATVVSVVDYYPFGSAMAGRKFNDNSYRFGFNGMEKDDEVKGNGNSYTTHYRLFDTRIGRWYSSDPKYKSYQSPYISFKNNPLMYVDPLGDTDYYSLDGEYIGHDGNRGNGQVIVINDAAVIENLNVNAESHEIHNVEAIVDGSYFELPPFEHRQRMEVQINDMQGKVRARKPVRALFRDEKGGEEIRTILTEEVAFTKYEVGGAGTNIGVYREAEVDVDNVDMVNASGQLHVNPIEGLDVEEIDYTWHFHPLGYYAIVNRGEEQVEVFIDQLTPNDMENIVGVGKYLQVPTGAGGDLEWARTRGLENNFMTSEEGRTYYFTNNTPENLENGNNEGSMTNHFYFNVQEGEEYIPEEE